MKPFEKCKIEELELTFGIKQVNKHPLLEQWINSKQEINPELIKHLEGLRDDMFSNANYWNEDEIKFQFISPFLKWVHFGDHRYSVFSQRILSSKLKNVNGEMEDMRGRVEMLVATGRQDPREPYFFLQEYKPERRTGAESDPVGQVIAAMLVAQEKNQHSEVLYGCYVNGRMWIFLILAGKEYSLSNAYNAGDDDIFQIFSILTTAKQYIEQSLASQ